MTITTVTPATVDPITIDDALLQLKILDDEDNDYVTALIKAATAFVESYTGMALVQRTLLLTIDEFPHHRARGRVPNPLTNGLGYGMNSPGLPAFGGWCEHDKALYLPNAPATAIDWIKYIDTDGTQQTWDAGCYVLDPNEKRPRIRPGYDTEWPATRRQPGAVTVQYKSGYAPDSSGDKTDYTTNIPADIKQAIRFIIGHWYLNREPVIVGAAVNDLPMTAQALLWRYKSHGF